MKNGLISKYFFELLKTLSRYYQQKLGKKAPLWPNFGLHGYKFNATVSHLLFLRITKYAENEMVSKLPS